MKNKKGKFIVFEGIDGSGTTTQSHLLRDKFSGSNIPVHLTFEPTNGPVGSVIRHHLNKRIVLDGYSLALLFAADRNDHIYNPVNGIDQFLNNGVNVISDRYLLSSIVYQQDCMSIDEIMFINKNVPAPDVTFFLDINSDKAFSRKIKGEAMREANDSTDLQAILEKKYREAAHSFQQKHNIISIDGEMPVDKIATIVWNYFSDKEML